LARYDDRRDNVFLALWTLAVVASTVSLLFYLGVRVRTVELGYELGAAHADLARRREVERVFLLERSALQTPERVELISRTLLGMREATADRMFNAGPSPRTTTKPPREESVAGVASRQGPGAP
jgi:cell division protein FtsL